MIYSSGQVIGRWTLLQRSPFPEKRRGYWECQCACGEVRHVYSGSLTSGESKSCGCLHRELSSERKKNKCNLRLQLQAVSGIKRCPSCKRDRATIDITNAADRPDGLYGYCRTCTLVRHARARAKRCMVAFDVTWQDIPEIEDCPICSVRFEPGVGFKQDSSPSIDRIRPEEGYVCGNIELICDRCNRHKNDSTPVERWLQAIHVLPRMSATELSKVKEIMKQYVTSENPIRIKEVA